MTHASSISMLPLVSAMSARMDQNAAAKASMCWKHNSVAEGASGNSNKRSKAERQSTLGTHVSRAHAPVFRSKNCASMNSVSTACQQRRHGPVCCGGQARLQCHVGSSLHTTMRWVLLRAQDVHCWLPESTSRPQGPQHHDA